MFGIIYLFINEIEDHHQQNVFLLILKCKKNSYTSKIVISPNYAKANISIQQLYNSDNNRAPRKFCHKTFVQRKIPKICNPHSFILKFTSSVSNQVTKLFQFIVQNYSNLFVFNSIGCEIVCLF